MDLRVFVLICVAAAFRPRPSAVLEVHPNDHQNYTYTETDFQRLRDEVNRSDPDTRIRRVFLKEAEIWSSFLKAHPEEGWRLFQKLAADEGWKAASSPAWPMLLKTHSAEAWHLFEKLATDEVADVRGEAVQSPAWPMLLETQHAEAWHLFEKLATDEVAEVRRRAAGSPAWPMLLKTHNAEAWHLFEKLATDEVAEVRWRAATSPAWPDLVKASPWESWQLFIELAGGQRLRGYPPLYASAWKPFGAVPRRAVAEHLNSVTPTNLQEMAMSIQEIADNGSPREVKDLPVTKGLATTLQRSANETWLGKVAELPLFAGNAAQRVSPAQNV